MPVRPMLLHRIALVSFRLFCKNLGNLQEFFGQMVYRPPWPKIVRTPMIVPHAFRASQSRQNTAWGIGYKANLSAPHQLRRLNLK